MIRIPTCDGCVPVGHVRHDGRAGVAHGLIEGGLEVGQALLVRQTELGAAQDAPELGPELGLDPGPGRYVDEDADGEVSDGTVTSEDVLDGVQRMVQAHPAVWVLQ